MDSVYSKRVPAGKRRTYFFDVKQTKGNDFYVTLTESTRRHDGEGYERHKLFLYKEDFNRFLASLEETIDYIKTELLPDYDYDEFNRRHLENDSRDNDGGATSDQEPPLLDYSDAETRAQRDNDTSW